MDTKVTGIVLMALVIQVNIVNGLKCYTCSTTKDWSKCDDIQKEVTCNSSISHCVKFEVTATGDLGIHEAVYTKLCSDVCDTKRIRFCNLKKEGVSINCKVNCCNGDLCNGASVSLVSGVIISACALLNAMFGLIQ